MSAEKLKQELNSKSNSKQAEILQRFFKTAQGEYAEGDIFIGLKVPDIRKIVKNYYQLPLTEINKILHSKIHEERLAALLILVEKAKKANEDDLSIYFNFYLKNTNWINNWDLVDLSAEHIVGKYLYGKDIKILEELAASKYLWERRISIISTFYFIKTNIFNPTLIIAEKLLHDEHDLIHKAVGWMLREIGKRNFNIEFRFLKKHYKTMPRTMLRYSIEKFPEELRQKFLKNQI